MCAHARQIWSRTEGPDDASQGDGFRERGSLRFAPGRPQQRQTRGARRGDSQCLAVACGKTGTDPRRHRPPTSALGIGYDASRERNVATRTRATFVGMGLFIAPDDFIVTNGGTEAISLALRATCKPGDTVAVESPTYYGLVGMLRELGLNALPIPCDSGQGMDPDALQSALRRTRISACALIPNFNNPTGSLMPDENKKRILELLAACEIPIIEDDIYGDLNHEGIRPRCLKTFDRDGTVLLCSSFSKTLAPGYRVGYIAGGRWHRRVMSLKEAQFARRSHFAGAGHRRIPA